MFSFFILHLIQYSIPFSFTQKPSPQNSSSFIFNIDWLLPWHANLPHLSILIHYFPGLVLLFSASHDFSFWWHFARVHFKHLPNKVGLGGPLFTLFFGINTCTLLTDEVSNPVTGHIVQHSHSSSFFQLLGTTSENHFSWNTKAHLKTLFPVILKSCYPWSVIQKRIKMPRYPHRLAAYLSNHFHDLSQYPSSLSPCR